MSDREFRQFLLNLQIVVLWAALYLTTTLALAAMALVAWSA